MRRVDEDAVRRALDRRRFGESDIQYRRYVGPLGTAGLHRVRSSTTGTTFVVSGPLTTFRPGQVVPTARNSGRQGETIVGVPPPGRRGALTPLTDRRVVSPPPAPAGYAALHWFDNDSIPDPSVQEFWLNSISGSEDWSVLDMATSVSEIAGRTALRNDDEVGLSPSTMSVDVTSFVAFSFWAAMRRNSDVSFATDTGILNLRHFVGGEFGGEFIFGLSFRGSTLVWADGLGGTLALSDSGVWPVDNTWRLLACHRAADGTVSVEVGGVDVTTQTVVDTQDAVRAWIWLQNGGDSAGFAGRLTEWKLYTGTTTAAVRAAETVYFQDRYGL